MLTDKKSNKKRITVLAVIFVILLIIVLGFVYYTYFTDTAPIITTGEKRVKTIDTEFNQAIFQNTEYRKLKKHGDLPVEAGTKGKVNPFRLPRVEVEEES